MKLLYWNELENESEKVQMKLPFNQLSSEFRKSHLKLLKNILVL